MVAKKAATGRITGGQVVFGTTKNLGDYNSKKAEVTLTFQIDEGADPSDIVSATGQECMRHVAEMLNGKAPAAAAPKVETVVNDAEKVAAAKALNDKAAGKTVKEPPPGVTVKETAKPKEPEGEDLDGDEFNEDEVILDVTDEQMSAALNQAVGRLKPKHGNKASMVVKELIVQFVDPPKKAHDIPQQQRPQFLQKLKDLA